MHEINKYTLLSGTLSNAVLRGIPVELKYENGKLYWKYTDSEIWTFLTDYAELKEYVDEKHDTVLDKLNTAVFTTVQELTDVQKTQARSNIGAASTEQVSKLYEKKVDTPSVATVGQNLKVKAVDENGKPTEWECVNDVQPDYNQNDENAPDYVKNRPFYKIENQKVCLEEQTITIIEEDGYRYKYNTLDNGILSISLKNPVWVSNKYIIVFDGVEYEATLYQDEGGTYFGINFYYADVTHIGADGLHFGLWLNITYDSNIGKYKGEYLKIVYTADANLLGEHTISIYEVETTIKHINQQFLPEPDMRIEIKSSKTNIEYVTKDDIVISKGSIDEIKNMISRNEIPNIELVCSLGNSYSGCFIFSKTTSVSWYDNLFSLKFFSRIDPLLLIALSIDTYDNSIYSLNSYKFEGEYKKII